MLTGNKSQMSATKCGTVGKTITTELLAKDLHRNSPKAAHH
jgi:hypothetical protein